MHLLWFFLRFFSHIGHYRELVTDTENKLMSLRLSEQRHKLGDWNGRADTIICKIDN